MWRPQSLAFLTLAVSFAARAAPPEAATVGYAQATGYFKKDTRPSLYQPLNLLDNREATAWCSSGPDPMAETLSVGFKGMVRIDEIRIYTGNGFDAASFKEFSRAKKFAIRGPDGANTFTVNDERGLQAVALNPPLHGTHFTIEILERYPADNLEMPPCVTDLVFYSGGKALNGTWLTPKLKLDRTRAPLMGTWFAGYEGAPDRVLSFFFDGTFKYVFQPFEANTPGKTLTGEYDVNGRHLILDSPKSERLVMQFKREKTDADGVRGQTLQFIDGAPPDLKEVFRDRL
jgi:hypothetical protein